MSRMEMFFFFLFFQNSRQSRVVSSLKKLTGHFIPQIAANFRVEVPIFKQFHKNVIGRGGTTIKKVTIFLYMFDPTGLH